MSQTERDSASTKMQISLDIIRHPPAFVLFDEWQEIEIKFHYTTQKTSNKATSKISEDNLLRGLNVASQHVSLQIRLSDAGTEDQKRLGNREEDKDRIPVLVSIKITKNFTNSSIFFIAFSSA